jgi:hypothetical protein
MNSVSERREQAVVFQELDHVAVEQPRLLHLARMARAMKNPYHTIRNLLLQREC